MGAVLVGVEGLLIAHDSAQRIEFGPTGNLALQFWMGRVYSSIQQSKSNASRFWTSRSMVLQLKRDEIPKLAQEVGEIKSIHLNRHLGVPR